MNCTLTEGSSELVAQYAAGALTGTERDAFEAHLEAGCESCRAELSQYMGLFTEVFAAVRPASPDPRTRASLLERVAESQRATGQPSPLRPHLAPAPQSRAIPPFGAGEKNAMPAGPAALRTVRADAGDWQETAVSGVRIRVLSVDRERHEFAALVRMAPGASYPGHEHRGPERCLVLEGALIVGDETLKAGDYQFAPPGSRPEVQTTETGCLLFITSSMGDEFA